MLSLKPAVAMPFRELPFRWARIDPSREWLVLSGASSDADVALLVGIVAQENDVPGIASIADAVDLLGVAEPFTVAGGLLIRRGDFVVQPGCCGMLDDWRGWDGLEPGALTPWMGHAPAPWVDTTADGAVIHADGGAEMGNVPDDQHVRVTYAEIAAALAKVRADLEAFQIRLEAWLSRGAPANKTLAPHFWDAFVRSPARAQRHMDGRGDAG